MMNMEDKIKESEEVSGSGANVTPAAERVVEATSQSGHTSFTRAEETDPEKQQQPVTTEETFTRTITGWRWAVVLISILSSTFLFALDNTIVADIQPTIVREFDAVGQIAWLSVAFLIGAASTNLIWGKVFGQFDAKWTYILNVVLFEVGSAVCGAAPNMNSMIIGRAICGVGGSGMYVGVMTLIAATTTLQERPMFVGTTGLTWGLGTVLGPIIGGAFTDSPAGWRWAFYINLCIGAACAPVYLFMLPSKDPRPGVSVLGRLRELDFIGGILIVGAFVSGVTAISFGGVQYPWSSPRIIGMFVCSGVLFILLGFQQVYTILTTTARRVIPIEFFHSRTMLILFAVTGAGATAVFVPIYIIPVFFQFTKGDSALDAGVRLLPFIFVMVFAIVANGGALSQYGLYMPWFLVGGLICAAGAALMYTVGPSTDIAHVYGYSVVMGFGVGLWGQAGYSIAQAIVEPHLVPLAIGFITCGQVTGITIALSIANSIFLNESQDAIARLLPNVPSSTIQAAIAGAGSSFVATLSPDLRTRVLAAIVAAQSKTYILVIVAGGVTAALSLIMKRERLFIAAGAMA